MELLEMLRWEETVDMKFLIKDLICHRINLYKVLLNPKTEIQFHSIN